MTRNRCVSQQFKRVPVVSVLFLKLIDSSIGFQSSAIGNDQRRSS